MSRYITKANSRPLFWDRTATAIFWVISREHSTKIFNITTRSSILIFHVLYIFMYYWWNLLSGKAREMADKMVSDPRRTSFKRVQQRTQERGRRVSTKQRPSLIFWLSRVIQDFYTAVIPVLLIQGFGSHTLGFFFCCPFWLVFFDSWRQLPDVDRASNRLLCYSIFLISLFLINGLYRSF